MVRRPPTALLALAALVVVAVLPGCGAASPVAASPTSSSCAAKHLPLHTPGQLTVSTQAVAYPPWFVDKDPSNQKGYESAFAYALAKRLGFAADQVKWTTTEFHDALAAGPKDFDVYINQVSITAARRASVDLSGPYADIAQGVVVGERSRFAAATSVAELKRAKIGAVAESTSFEAIRVGLHPTPAAVAFESNEDAVTALEHHRVDGIVVDLPVALYFAGIRYDDQVVVVRSPGRPDSHPSSTASCWRRGAR